MTTVANGVEERQATRSRLVGRSGAVSALVRYAPFLRVITPATSCLVSPSLPASHSKLRTTAGPPPTRASSSLSRAGGPPRHAGAARASFHRSLPGRAGAKKGPGPRVPRRSERTSIGQAIRDQTRQSQRGRGSVGGRRGSEEEGRRRPSSWSTWRGSRTTMLGGRPLFVLFGSSIVQYSFSNGGWGAVLADIYARKVPS